MYFNQSTWLGPPPDGMTCGSDDEFCFRGKCVSALIPNITYRECNVPSKANRFLRQLRRAAKKSNLIEPLEPTTSTGKLVVIFAVANFLLVGILMVVIWKV